VRKVSIEDSVDSIALGSKLKTPAQPRGIICDAILFTNLSFDWKSKIIYKYMNSWMLIGVDSGWLAR
jgi:hypothetical protein